LDVRDSAALYQVLSEVCPDVVVNAAAWTDVNLAESQVDSAYEVNAVAPGVIAQALGRMERGHLVHVSTDYVFEGQTGFVYGEESATHPLNVYGRSKQEGERAALEALPGRVTVLRTAWLYSDFGRNFVRSIVAARRAGHDLRVVDDQFGHPTWVHDVAHRILEMAELPPGELSQVPVLHAVNLGVTSWFGLAQAVVVAMGGSPSEVQPIPSRQVHQAAVRPYRVELSDAGPEVLGLSRMRDWREALQNAMPSVITS
jgi:dTDP-4-dehydrorhamnose reductase